MPKIWCSISGHGFGHGTQTILILNELGKRFPDLHVILRTDLPQPFLKESLAISWEHYPSRQDVGCVQNGPLIIDEGKTWMAYELFHKDWSHKVRAEAQLIRSHRPALIISNISYLGIEAGAKTGIPTVAMGSVTWDRVLEYFSTQGSAPRDTIIHQIRKGYQKAELMIRFAPLLPMEAFSNIVDVNPIVGPPHRSTGAVRDLLKMNPGERLVLVAFGGIRIGSLPLDKLEACEGYRFLIDGTMPIKENSRVTSLTSLPFSFRQIFAEADFILTKPGYATIVEAVRNALPVLYVRRYNFVDEQILVDYAHRYGRAMELQIDHLNDGAWIEALEATRQLRVPIETAPDPGTRTAADILAKYLE